MGVIVRQKVEGKGKPWWVFIAHNGKRTSRMVGDKKATEEVASKIRAKLELGEFNFEMEEKKPELTFKEYAEEWITKTAPAVCRESTLHSYQSLLKLHVLPYFGHFNLKDINKGDIKDFFVNKTLEKCARSSMVHMKNVISGILCRAVDKDVIPVNLSLGVKIPKEKRKEEGEKDSAVDPLTAEETKLLLDTARIHFSKDYPLCLVLLRTGMRIGEAFALKWGDIDFNSRFIHVQRGLSLMKIQKPKNGKTRRVDMSLQLADALATHKIECKKKGLALGLGDAPEYVFTNEKGGFIDISNWRRRIFNKILEKARLRRIRIHDCRHTYATLRISKGDNIADVSNQLGHHSVKLTLDIYYHWLAGKEKSEVDDLDHIGETLEEQRQVQNEG